MIFTKAKFLFKMNVKITAMTIKISYFVHKNFILLFALDIKLL